MRRTPVVARARYASRVEPATPRRLPESHSQGSLVRLPWLVMVGHSWVRLLRDGWYEIPDGWYEIPISYSSLRESLPANGRHVSNASTLRQALDSTGRPLRV